MRIHPALFLLILAGFRPQQGPDPSDAVLERLRNSLGLSSEQTAGMKEILDDDREYRKKLDGARTTKINALLSETQKKTFAELPDPFRADTGRAESPFPGFGTGGPGRGGEPSFMRGGESNALDVARKLLSPREEEWKVLKPKLAKIVALRQSIAEDFAEQRSRGPGGPPGAPAGAGTSALASARAELRSALTSSGSAETIAAKSATLRKALEDARKELQSHQKDLSLLLTADQAAAIAGFGYLE